MKPETKAELISITHTFVAVLGTVVMANASTLDVNNLSKEALVSFGIAVLRSVIKTMWLTYFPINQVNQG
jgi:ABC-type enterochelin transport system permease subunit